jgi:phosphatidate cytidylyltransferase
LLALAVAIWAFRFAPSLKMGIPALKSVGNRLLTGLYAFSLLAFFIALYALYRRSPIFLLSVGCLVFIADIGAFAFGKAFGKRKLAPKISPSKTWAGAVGGWVSALAFAALLVALTPFSIFSDTFMSKFHLKR